MKPGLAFIAAAASALAVSAGTADASLPAGATFNYTGSEQTYTVPAGVTLIHVEAVGGAGAAATAGNSPGAGGAGARVRADLPVTAGDVLYVEVGGNALPGGTGGGGFNGGGQSDGQGGGGGGASDIRTCPRAAATCYSPASRILVAGAGGGGAAGSANTLPPSPGGTGGDAGEDGDTKATLTQPPFPTQACLPPPTAGTQSAGGMGEGNPSPDNTDGSFGAGGDAATTDISGGGGGAGWFGGGGGDHGEGDWGGCGGAGGSSFVIPRARNVSTAIDTTHTPRVTITPIGGRPDAATSAARSVTATSAVLAGTVGANGAPTQYRFEYGRTEAYDRVTPWTVASGADQLASARLSKLPARTTFHFRLVAVSAFGTRAGADRTFKTKALVVDKLKLSRTRFPTTGPRRGTTIGYRLSGAARVTFTFARRVHGRYRAIGRARRQGALGTNALGFSGRLHGRKLKRGMYSVAVRATDSAGHASKAAVGHFRVVRR